jgi:hypothetical protein
MGLQQVQNTGPCTCGMRINPAHLAGEANEASIVRF